VILLISDLHLQEERPDISRAFLDLLDGRARHAKALYILGDFFEAWIGDDAMTAFQQSICQAMRRLSDSGTAIFLMHGNRDFLIGQAFCDAAGCTLLSDPSVIELGGEQVLLMHGDTLCTRDVGYMKMRRLLRNPLSLWVLRHLPLSARYKLARKLRSESRTQTRMKSTEIVDVTPEEVPKVMAAHGGVRWCMAIPTGRRYTSWWLMGSRHGASCWGTGTAAVGPCRLTSRAFSWRRSSFPDPAGRPLRG
jgi:UDP-2,3-diacylglucosamine hydrolase